MRKATVHASVILLAVLALGACSTMTVSTDYDKTASFAAYKTFDFIPAQEVKNPLIRQRIEDAITAQLVAKGLTRSSDNPDLLIAGHGKLSSETHFDTTSFGYGMGGWGGGYWGGYGGYGAYGGMGSSTTVAREVPVGTLIIDLVDAKEKKLIWQAVASDTLDTNARADERDYRINKAMEKIFSGYPPQVQ
jgi:hypothetical protein